MYVDLSNLTDGFSSKFRVLSYFVAIIKIKKLKKKFIFMKKKIRIVLIYLLIIA